MLLILGLPYKNLFSDLFPSYGFDKDERACELRYSISYNTACSSNEDLDQHSRGLIRVFAKHAVDSKAFKASSRGQQRHVNKYSLGNAESRIICKFILPLRKHADSNI